LNSKEYENIHVLNRAQIIDDAFHFAVEKKLNFSVFWEIAKYLSKERDFIAWYPMIKAFEFMSNIFVFSRYYPQFQVNIINFIKKLFTKLINYNLIQRFHMSEIIEKYICSDFIKILNTYMCLKIY